MTLLFELNANEIAAILSAVQALPRDESEGECVWLRTEATRREWQIVSSFGRFEYTVEEAHEYITDGWLPVSERAIAFADLLEPDAVTLSLVDGAIVASSLTTSAAIDLVAGATFHSVERSADFEAFVIVSRPEFTQMLFAARTIPPGASDMEWLSPPMWMQITTGGPLALHVDWSEVVPSRSTFRLDTLEAEGDVTVAIGHNAICQFLQRFTAGSGDLEILVGSEEHDGEERPTVWLHTDEWDFVTRTIDPLQERWEKRIDELFEDDEFHVIEHQDNEWIVRANDCQVRVALHHGHPDTARVTAVLVSRVADSPELLHELNALNVAASNVRFFWDDGAVRSVIDVRLSEFDGLGPTVKEVALAARRYGELLAVFGAVAA